MGKFNPCPLLWLLVYFASFLSSCFVFDNCLERNSWVGHSCFSMPFRACGECEALTAHGLGHFSGLRLHQEIPGAQILLAAPRQCSSAETNSLHRQPTSKPLWVTLVELRGKEETKHRWCSRGCRAYWGLCFSPRSLVSSDNTHETVAG